MAVYQTPEDICNKALQELGCTLIVSLSDKSRNAVQCNFLYDKSRAGLLNDHVWNFAIEYAQLVASAEPNLPPIQAFQNGEERNRFLLPADFLRVADQMPRIAGHLTQMTTGGIKSTDYMIEGGIYLLTQNASVLLRYVADVTVVPEMDVQFCEALAAKMCVEGLAETLTQNPVKRQLAEQWFDRTIVGAKIRMCIESGSDEPVEEMLKFARVLEMMPQAGQQAAAAAGQQGRQPR